MEPHDNKRLNTDKEKSRQKRKEERGWRVEGRGQRSREKVTVDGVHVEDKNLS